MTYLRKWQLHPPGPQERSSSDMHDSSLSLTLTILWLWNLSICLWNLQWTHILPCALSVHSWSHNHFSPTLQQYSLIRLSLSGLGPFLPSMGNTTVLMLFWKANLVTWLPSCKLFNKSHCSQENSTILSALFTCPASLCKHLYTTIYFPPQTEPLFLVSQITHAFSHWKHQIGRASCRERV